MSGSSSSGYQPHTPPQAERILKRKRKIVNETMKAKRIRLLEGINS